jgi:hypothetical protein
MRLTEAVREIDAPSRWPVTFLTCLVVALVGNAALLIDDHIFRTVDLYTHYRWGLQFYQALMEGVPYPRWAAAASNGLGEPAFVYYPPIYFYVLSLVRVVTGNLWVSIKVVATVANLLTGIVAYALARRAVGFRWALLAAVLVQTMPFLLFMHGYLNAFPWHASVPLILLAIYFTLEPSKQFLDWRLSVAVALLAMTHILAAFMALLCIPWACLTLETSASSGNRLTAIARWSSTVGVGLLLAMPYLLPALGTWNLIHPEAWNIPKIVDWRNAFAFPIVTSRLWGLRWFAIQWVLAGSVLVLAAVATAAAYRLHRRRIAPPPGLVPLVCIAWAALFFTCELSYPLYASLSVLRKVQYPYRFLCVAAPAATIAGVLALWSVVRRDHGLPWRVLCSLALIGSLALFAVVQLEIQREGRHPDLGPKVLLGRFGALEYYTASRQPGWTAYVDSGGLQTACRLAGGDSQVLLDRSHEKLWLIRTNSNTTLPLPLFAFPAWSIFVDGQRRPSDTDPETGLLAVTLPSGVHRIQVVWSGLPEEREGLVIGLLTAAWLVGVSLKNWMIRARRAGAVAPTGRARPAPGPP